MNTLFLPHYYDCPLRFQLNLDTILGAGSRH